MGMGVEIKNFFRNFTILIFRDRFFQIVVGGSLLINLAVWVFLYFKFYPLGRLENILPLHYNIYFGIDFVGEWKKVFVIPLVGIFFITINFLIADMIYLRDKTIGYFLVGTGLFVQLILSGAAFMVAMINQ